MPTPRASVARVARAHGINANQGFGWRRLYLAGRLGEQKLGVKLLPLRVSARVGSAGQTQDTTEMPDSNTPWLCQGDTFMLPLG